MYKDNRNYCYLRGWYLRPKPVGESKAGGLPHPSLSPFPPLPLSIPLSFQTNQWAGREGQIQCGGSSPASPYKYHPGYLRCVPPFRYNSTASRTDRRTDVEVNRDRADRVVTREKKWNFKTWYRCVEFQLGNICKYTKAWRLDNQWWKIGPLWVRLTLIMLNLGLSH